MRSSELRVIYDDVKLAHDIKKDFDLVGRAPASHVLPGKLVLATLEVSDLQNCASRVQEAVRATPGSCRCDQQEERLWAKTGVI